MIVRVSVVLRKTVLNDLSESDYQSQDDDDDFDDDFRSGCRSVSQSHHKPSFSGHIHPDDHTFQPMIRLLEVQTIDSACEVYYQPISWQQRFKEYT